MSAIYSASVLKRVMDGLLLTGPGRDARADEEDGTVDGGCKAQYVSE
jgi:hypothetical protein